MKHFFLASILFLGVTNWLQAQNDKLLDAISQDACDCLSKKDLSNLTQEKLNMELGFCIMECLGKHPNATKDLKLDFSSQTDMEQFGEKIGARMVTKCPSTMMKVISLQQQQQEGAAAATNKTVTQIIGTFKGIEGDDFAFMTVESNDGSTYRILWLSEFEGVDQLDKAKGRQVEIGFQDIQCYSPKMKKYLTRKEVVSLKIL